MPTITRKPSGSESTARATVRRNLRDRRHAAAPVRLSYLAGQLDKILTRQLSEALASHGLTLPQYTALSVLRARARSSNAQLAQRSLITPQAASAVVKSMEANGWVTRVAGPLNRRVGLLSLTKAGETLLAQCDGAADRVEQSMLGEIDEHDSQILKNLLSTCVRNLRAA
ncbi:DNA-binding MarR family transcriptional regulator [Paraburkholderia sp. 32]